MSDRISNTPVYPTGPVIEKILRPDDQVQRGDLGDLGGAGHADISPAFSPVRPQLEQLYAMPNLEDYVASQLAPQIEEAWLLLPNRFNNALRLAIESLLAAEEEDPRNAHILRRVRTLMREQAALRELVQMYRSALLKG